VGLRSSTTYYSDAYYSDNYSLVCLAWLMDVNAGTSEYMKVLFTVSEDFFTVMGGFNLDFRIIVGTDSLDHQRYGIDQMFIVMQRTSLLIQCT
jgi:hypothetical protein